MKEERGKIEEDFVINKDLIELIPSEEFENLAKKSLRILKEMYENPKFTNEGDFDERTKRYEERSNPVIRFIEERCEEKEEGMIGLRDFTNSCNEYLKEKHLRILNSNQIGKILRDEGFIVGARKIDNISTKVIMNLHIKTTTTTRTTQISNHSLSVKPTLKMGGSSGSSGFTQEKVVESPDVKKIMEDFSE